MQQKQRFSGKAGKPRYQSVSNGFTISETVPHFGKCVQTLWQARSHDADWLSISNRCLREDHRFAKPVFPTPDTNVAEVLDRLINGNFGKRLNARHLACR
ncbi:hypothetical protein XM53_22265 [Roseovarius atlanticus]|uniref:Uncharacterized protein n=1 Tax=Roseovarius atlanticus TaxID=1641875 RepID=A0A0T5NNE3_9RHOB|nr:hypothetical protein XM53_22265 [Roseovarius atlanticus]